MTSVYVERFESERVEKLLKVTPGELYNHVYAEEGGDAPDSIEYLATVQRWLQRVYDNGSVWESEYTRSGGVGRRYVNCLLYTSPSPRDRYISRMPSSA